MRYFKLRYIRKAFRVLRRAGLFALLRRLRGKRRRVKKESDFAPAGPGAKSYIHRAAENDARYEARLKQEAATAAQSVSEGKTPLISLLCPSFNPKVAFFAALVDSLKAQTYPTWELCIADGGSSDGRLAAIKKLIDGDARFHLRPLGENLGIALNTAEAFAFSHGEYIGFIDHDDVLCKDALLEFVSAINANPNADFFYCDEDKITGTERHDPHYKPDFSPDTLMSYNYMNHLVVVSRALFTAAGGMRAGFDGSQDHDFALRATALAKNVAHIPKVLYHWRAHSGSVAGGCGGKDYAWEAGRKAVAEQTPHGVAEHGLFQNSYRARYPIAGEPLVSIIIPNHNSAEMLKRLLLSIEELSTYTNYELIIVENRSDEPEIFDYYDALKANKAAKIVKYKKKFNYSAANNLGAQSAHGKFLLFLNNDTEVFEPTWIEAMLEHAGRSSIGAVGAKLIYPDGFIQHAGVVVGMNGWADHVCQGMSEQGGGYYCDYIINVVRNTAAVTGACMMVEKEKFERAGGFDETFTLCGSDVELCLRLISRGYLNLYTPYAKLVHHESATRAGAPIPQSDFIRSYDAYREYLLRGDPYYSLSLDYASLVPRIAYSRIPPINLNPMANK